MFYWVVVSIVTTVCIASAVSLLQVIYEWLHGLWKR